MNNDATSSNTGLVHEEMESTQLPSEEQEAGNSSSSSSSEEDSSSEESGNDSDTGDEKGDGLSEYERMRLRNIKRNQARLAELGLLTNTNTAAASATGVGGESNSSALTNLFTTSDSNTTYGNKRPRRKKRETVAIPPERFLRRRCVIAYRAAHEEKTMESDRYFGSKTRWSVEEDEELKKRVRLHGEGKWKAILDNSSILQKRYEMAPSGKIESS